MQTPLKTIDAPERIKDITQLLVGMVHNEEKLLIMRCTDEITGRTEYMIVAEDDENERIIPIAVLMNYEGYAEGDDPAGEDKFDPQERYTPHRVQVPHVEH